MSIAPIVRTVQVKAAPEKAFELFVSQMGAWWPRGGTIGKGPHAEIVLEPRVDGKWLERDADGNETQWGKVLAWEPPGRVLLAWQINTQWVYDPNLVTEVELTFARTEGGGTRVTLEHRHLERFGANAEAHAARLNGGWPTRLDQFASYVNAH